MFFVLGGTLGQFVDFGLRLGAVGVHFGVYLWFWGQADPFFDVAGKKLKKYKKGKKQGAGIDVFSMKFLVFPENAKVRVDCAGASGLRFRPLLFWLCASIFRHLFLHRFFVFFGPPLGPPKSEVGGTGGTPLIMFNQAYS